MALPRVNESPVYSMVIPSMNREVRFRPFLMKEQKILMMASESNDRKQILQAIVNTFLACVEEKIDAHKLSTFDIDYCFTQLRAKSVGEKAELTFSCSNCKEPVEHIIQLDKIQPPKNVKSKNIIEINNDIKIRMKYPSYSDFLNNKLMESETTTTEMIMEFLYVCMESIINKDEEISLKNESKEEIERFLDSLSTEQFTKVAEFVQNIPRLSHTFDITCPKCNHVEKKTVEGLESFF